jgi:hypothetical protein
MKLYRAVMALVCVPVALASSNVPYPKENVAEFVAGKLDVTTLPSTIRPKPEKKKKTFDDYGYVTQQLGEQDALVETGPAGSQIRFKILEQKASGIYVCVSAAAKNVSGGQTQQVLLLKLKDQSALLKARESWKEFAACPVMGVDPLDTTNSYVN